MLFLPVFWDVRKQKGECSIQKSVPCPFCGLCCDDLQVSVLADRSLRLRKGGCVRAQERFTGAGMDAEPMVAGKPVSLAEALRQAATLIRGSRMPLYGGLATDIEGFKAFLQLADHTGGVVDHAASEGYFRNARVVQTEGWVTTTIGEIRNRADLIIMAGTDGVTAAPRFFEKCVWTRSALFKPQPQDRRVIYIGRGLDTAAGVSPTGRQPLHLPGRPDQLAEIFLALKALYEGRILAARRVAGVPRAALEDVLAHIRNASYGVIVWNAAELSDTAGDHAVEAINLLIKKINLEQRCAGFPLSGSNNIQGAAQAATWQSGYPLRVSFANGKPHHDADAYATRTLLARGEADCFIWVSTFDTDLAPPPHDTSLILIGRPGSVGARKSAVYLPVGIPGIDHIGSFTRGDSVAALPLRKLRDTSLMSAAMMAHALMEALQTAGRS